MIPVRALKKHSYGSRVRHRRQRYSVDEKHIEFMVRAGLVKISPPPKRKKIVAREVAEALPPETTPVERFEIDLPPFDVEKEPEKPRKARRSYRRRDMEADKE